MSLYPTTILDAESAGLRPNPIPSGSLIVIPIDMTTVAMTQVMLVQVSYTQDYSLRTWLSLHPDGLAIAGVIPILKTAGIPLVIHIADQILPPDVNAIAVEPGQYMLNVLNLTNEANVFSFSKTDLA